MIVSKYKLSNDRMASLNNNEINEVSFYIQLTFGSSINLMRTKIQEVLDAGRPKGRPVNYFQTLPSSVGEVRSNSMKAKLLMSIKRTG